MTHLHLNVNMYLARYGLFHFDTIELFINSELSAVDTIQRHGRNKVSSPGCLYQREKTALSVVQDVLEQMLQFS